MAIQKSNVLGLTETLVGDGTYVRDFSMRSYFRELYDSKILARNYNVINDFRMILQIGSIRLAFEKPTIDESAAELEKIYKAMEAAAEANDLAGIQERNIQKCIDAEMESRIRSYKYYENT
jgi:GntR family transcriptional regulator, transcriptional repressor for pyruvate dehydrogenase complex